MNDVLALNLIDWNTGMATDNSNPTGTAYILVQNEKPIPVRYINDTGSLGANIAGWDVFQNIVKLGFSDFKKLKTPRTVKGAWNSDTPVMATHCICCNMKLSTDAGSLRVDKVFLHVLNVPTNGTIFLGEKFNRKLGIPSQRVLMAQAAADADFYVCNLEQVHEQVNVQGIEKI